MPTTQSIVVQKPEQTLLLTRHTNDQQHVKRFSTTPIIREMKIRTTMRYLVTQVRMTIIIKSTESEVISKNGAQYTWPRKPHKSCRSRGSDLRVHFKNT